MIQPPTASTTGIAAIERVFDIRSAVSHLLGIEEGSDDSTVFGSVMASSFSGATNSHSLRPSDQSRRIPLQSSAPAQSQSASDSEKPRGTRVSIASGSDRIERRL